MIFLYEKKFFSKGKDITYFRVCNPFNRLKRKEQVSVVRIKFQKSLFEKSVVNNLIEIISF